MDVAFHPWVLIRSNPVETRDHADRASQDAAAQALRAAQTELVDAVDDVVSATMPLGRAGRPDHVRRSARRLARLARRSIDRVIDADGIDITSPVDAVVHGRWLAAMRGRDSAALRLAVVVDEELAADRVRLAAVLAHPALRLAAPMSSPSLADAAAAYAAGSISSSLRKSEPHLRRLSGRALDRVSPFSHYTVVGLGWMGEPITPSTSGSRPGPGPISSGAAPERRVTVDLASLSRLVRARLEALQPLTPLVAAPSHVGADGLRRIRVPVDDASGRSRVLDGSVRTVTVRDTEDVAAVMTAAGTPADAASLAALVGARAVGLDGARGDDAPPPLAAVITALRRVGGLRTWDPVPMRPDDAPRATATVLRAQAASWGDDPYPARLPLRAGLLTLADDLEVIADAVDRVRAAGPGERCASVRAVRRRWAEAGGEPARELYEDVTMPAVVPLDPSVLVGVRADLARLARVADLFDNTHIGHALLHRGVVARTGGRSTLSFEEFAGLVPLILGATSTDRAEMIAEVCEHDPAVGRLVELRAAAAETLLQASLRGEEEVRWSDADLDRWSREIPAAVRRQRSSLAWFLQNAGAAPAPAGGGRPRASGASPIERVVLNAIHDGDAQMSSRFLDAFGHEALTSIRERLHAQLGPDTIELAPVHGFNANAHPWLLPSAFATDGRWPSQTPVDPSAVTVHVGERTIGASLGGRRIHPHYIGFLVPFLLPAAEAALYMLGRGPLVRIDLGTDVERLAPRDGIVALPRVVAGSVVVTRRAWSVPLDEFPMRRPDEGLSGALMRMEAFRARHGIGERVFVRSEPHADALWQQFVAMRSKPMSVDLTSPLDLRCLPAWVSGAERVRITEALPDPAHRPADPFGFGSCTEYVLETVARTGPAPTRSATTAPCPGDGR
jgi:hypothetical protein